MTSAASNFDDCNSRSWSALSTALSMLYPHGSDEISLYVKKYFAQERGGRSAKTLVTEMGSVRRFAEWCRLQKTDFSCVETSRFTEYEQFLQTKRESIDIEVRVIRKIAGYVNVQVKSEVDELFLAQILVSFKQKSV